jgi:hypothetical protein
MITYPTEDNYYFYVFLSFLTILIVMFIVLPLYNHFLEPAVSDYITSHTMSNITDAGHLFDGFDFLKSVGLWD